MRRVFLVIFLLALTLAGGLLYAKLVVIGRIGALSILAAAALLVLAAVSLATVLLCRANKPDVAKKLWLSLITALITYAAIDLLAGAALIGRISPPIVADSRVHHRLRPNQVCRISTSEFSYQQRVNSMGLRGDEIQLEKPPGTTRILMLGDSFTMGKGVPDDQTFSALLNQRFAAQSDSGEGKKIEVINGGVDSYAPILSYLQLEGLFDRLKPDLVIYNFDMSDLLQESAYRRNAVIRDGRPTAVPGQTSERTGLLDKLRHWIDRRLFVSRLIIYYVERWSTPTPQITVDNVVTRASDAMLKHTLADDKEDRSGQWAKVFDSILRMKQLCESRSAAFALTTYPWGHQAGQDAWIPGRYQFVPQDAAVSDRSEQGLAEFAARNEIDFFSLFPAFQSHADPAGLYFQNDMHWTAAGHALMAAELEKLIRSELSKAESVQTNITPRPPD